MQRPLLALLLAVIVGIILFRMSRPPSRDTGDEETVEGPIKVAVAGQQGETEAPPAPAGEAIEAAGAGEREDLPDPEALRPEPLVLDFSRPPFERKADGRVFKTDVIALANDLNDEENDPEADLQALVAVIESYRTIFRENPVAGENHEVVAALTGENPYRLVLIDPGHPAINSQRELTDRWGEPYRFHPISRAHMELSSAGPDRQFGTPDDVRIEDKVVIGDRGAGP